jgi:hypothetical protein
MIAFKEGNVLDIKGYYFVIKTATNRSQRLTLKTISQADYALKTAQQEEAEQKELK